MTVAIRGSTRLTAVLGWPITHSRSPEMLNAAFVAAGLDVVMVPIGVPPTALASAIATLQAAGALGASVTVPHKVEIAALCTELTDEAREIGAVNCVQLDAESRIVGHNTDSGGFVDGLAEAGLARDRLARVVLLGGGGAARAVAHGLRDAEVVVIARDPARVWSGAVARAWTDTHLRHAFATADLVVDCTSIALGVDEATLVGKLPVEALQDHAWVASLVYHRRTALLERAHARGLATVDGRAMLVHQGARAFAIWTGTAAPVETMRRALDDALRSSRA